MTLLEGRYHFGAIAIGSVGPVEKQDLFDSLDVISGVRTTTDRQPRINVDSDTALLRESTACTIRLVSVSYDDCCRNVTVMVSVYDAPAVCLCCSEVSCNIRMLYVACLLYHQQIFCTIFPH
jgi:hypothetical protein